MEKVRRIAIRSKSVVIVSICLICIFTATFIFCAYKYCAARRYYDDSADAYVKISNEYVTAKETETTDSSSDIGNDDTEDTVYDEESPIDVNFEELTAQCNRGEVVAWLYSEGTVIDYPVVRCEDNSFYLEHLLDGTYNPCGTLFVDCRNAGDFTDTNTIVYGHHMADGQMFNTLKYYRKDPDYYLEHPVMYLNTPDGNYKVLIYSTFISDTQSIAFKTSFENSDEINEFISYTCAQSLIDTDVTVSSEDRFITLITCSYEFNNARTVVCGVLRPVG